MVLASIRLAGSLGADSVPVGARRRLKNQRKCIVQLGRLRRQRSATQTNAKLIVDFAIQSGLGGVGKRCIATCGALG
jgi:hypothetical protein